MTPTQLKGMTTEQLRGMTTEQLKARRAQLMQAQATAPAPTQPGGMTSEQLRGMTTEQLKARRAQLQSQAPREEEPWYEDFGEGLAVSGMDTYYGVKDLVTDLDEEDRATLADWKADAAQSGWGTAGQVAGELAQFAVPGGLALKGAKYLPKAARAAGAVAGEIGSGALLGATQLPGRGETRGGEAAKEATGAALGMGVGKVLSKAVRGAKKSKEAKELLKRGVKMTPGEMAESPSLRGAETYMGVTPVLAQGTKAAKKRSSEAWNLDILNQGAPRGAKSTKVGPEGGNQLTEAMREAYGKAWKEAGPIDVEAGRRVVDNLEAAAPVMTMDAARKLKGVVGNVEKAVIGQAPNSAETVDRVLRKALRNAKDDTDLVNLLKEQRTTLRSALPKARDEALRKIDGKYPAYLTAKDAIGRAKQTEGVFTPAQATTSQGVVAKGAFEENRAPLQKALKLGRATVGAKQGGEPLEWMRRLATAAPSPPPAVMDAAGRLVMGDTHVQKGIQLPLDYTPENAAMREIVNALRSPAGWGVALTPE